MPVSLVNFILFLILCHIQLGIRFTLAPIHICRIYEANLAHCSENVSGIVLPSVQQHPNGVDCGVFAIAFAVDILNGFAEIGKRFDVGKIRSHLERRRIYVISEKSQTHQVIKGAYIYADIYCICRAHSMKKIPREMKMCLWQNVLNVVIGTTKNV